MLPTGVPATGSAARCSSAARRPRPTSLSGSDSRLPRSAATSTSCSPTARSSPTPIAATVRAAAVARPDGSRCPTRVTPPGPRRTTTWRLTRCATCASSAATRRSRASPGTGSPSGRPGTPTGSPRCRSTSDPPRSRRRWPTTGTPPRSTTPPSASRSASTTARSQHVAEEFPTVCEAETEAIGRLVGRHVTRLATIARGDGVCTTHIPLTDVSITARNPSGGTCS